MTKGEPLPDARLLKLLSTRPKRTSEVTINLPDYNCMSVLERLHRLADRGLIVREAPSGGRRTGFRWRLPT
jgi:predicted transcriptional regulator